jgi:hypothetical protein
MLPIIDTATSFRFLFFSFSKHTYDMWCPHDKNAIHLVFFGHQEQDPQAVFKFLTQEIRIFFRVSRHLQPLPPIPHPWASSPASALRLVNGHIRIPRSSTPSQKAGWSSTGQSICFSGQTRPRALVCIQAASSFGRFARAQFWKERRCTMT